MDSGIVDFAYENCYGKSLYEEKEIDDTGFDIFE